MTNRLDIIRQAAADHGADGALVTAMHDIRWSVGFTGSNAVLLVLPEAAHFVTDGRYREQAAREVRGAEIHVPGYQLFEHAASLVSGAARVLAWQSDHLTLAGASHVSRCFDGISWRDAAALLTPFVARKTPEEVAAITRAQRITEAVFGEVCTILRPGMTEQEVAAEIVYRHLRRGAQRMAFEPIVASGPNGALPHARPSDRRIQPGDLVVLDFGCVVDGYASDMTRTVAVGEPGDEPRRVYEVVRQAQQAALDAARAGLTTGELDASARDVIAAAGYRAFFSHSLGHGIGLQTHEWPRLSQQTSDVLPPGCAVTIEPGIYLPGRFGVRIEDIVVLADGGCDNLTRAPKDLLVL